MKSGSADSFRSAAELPDRDDAPSPSTKPETEWVIVKRSAIKWMEENYPVLMEKSGLAAAPSAPSVGDVVDLAEALVEWGDQCEGTTAKGHEILDEAAQTLTAQAAEVERLTGELELFGAVRAESIDRREKLEAAEAERDSARAGLRVISDWHLIGPLTSEQGTQLLAISKYAREKLP